MLMAKGAYVVNINRYGLSSQEYKPIQVSGDSREDIEKKLFTKNIGKSDFKADMLNGSKGIELALKLLEGLKAEKQESETRKGYEDRVGDSAMMLIEKGMDDEDKKH
jgi:hypothetical protein